ncbi:MAG TPA: hypothetical protein VFW62_08210 [bacterium]|nr:hypothetical protein [bacterium]
MRQGERYQGPGLISQGDLRTEVECQYEVTRVDGVTNWHGRFAGADPASEPEPGAAQLLAGGKGASIIVVRVAAGTGSGRFEGNGPPPA